MLDPETVDLSLTTVSRDLKDLLNTPEPPELGPERRKITESLAEIDGVLGPKANPLLRATVLLWHDHLDESHNIAQGIETRDGSYLHGIMHRREPDYGNAKYWFHRVGRHACFEPLAKTAASVLSKEEKLTKRLLPGREWDPFAFIDACEEVARGSLSDEQAALLRKIQAAELTLLFDHFLAR